MPDDLEKDPFYCWGYLSRFAPDAKTQYYFNNVEFYLNDFLHFIVAKYPHAWREWNKLHRIPPGREDE